MEPPTLPLDVQRIIYRMYLYGDGGWSAKNSKVWAVCKDWMRFAELRIEIPTQKYTKKHVFKWGNAAQRRWLKWAHWGLPGQARFRFNYGGDISFVIRWLDALQVVRPDAAMALALKVRAGFLRSLKQARTQVIGLPREWTCIRTLLIHVEAGYSASIPEEDLDLYEVFGRLFCGLESYKVRIGGRRWISERVVKNGELVWQSKEALPIEKDMCYLYANADPWARPEKRRKLE